MAIDGPTEELPGVVAARTEAAGYFSGVLEGRSRMAAV